MLSLSKLIGFNGWLGVNIMDDSNIKDTGIQMSESNMKSVYAELDGLRTENEIYRRILSAVDNTWYGRFFKSFFARRLRKMK